MNSKYNLDQQNFVFITLDCCRYDTLVKANAPFIKSVGKVARALTNGTYTLPSHISSFMGYIPTAVDMGKTPYYTAARQLWRLKSGRNRSLDSVGVMLDGDNIVEGFNKIGYKTAGFGGVRWFRNRTLTSIFDEFNFRGPDINSTVFEERRPEHFVLNDLDKITQSVDEAEKYFLFVNCLETHVPYDTADYEISDRAKEIIQKYAPIWGCKGPVDTISDGSREDLEYLHQWQIKAVEYLDEKIKQLVSKLPGKKTVIICGDHGECFGENGLWGHGIPEEKVMEVPLVIGEID